MLVLRTLIHSRLLTLLLLAVLLGFCSLSSCGGGGGGGGNQPPQNQPPVASFTASAAQGAVPLAVTFSGLLSTDSDGSITLFQWDFDGDSIIDFQSAAPQASFMYTQAGSFTITLQVTDNQGAVSSTTKTVVVSASVPAISGIDSVSPEAGQGVQLTLVSGNPAVFYTDLNHRLLYTRALDKNGASWSGPLLVLAEPALKPACAFIDGNPAVVCKGLTQKKVLYVRASNPIGSAWGAPQVAGQFTDFGATGTQSLIIAGGNPAVVFITTGSGQSSFMTFARAADPDGADWAGGSGTDITPELDGDARNAVAIVAGGNPSIAYQEGAALKFIRALDANGHSWPGLGTVVDASAAVDGPIALTIVAGRPALAYCASGLFYLRADDANGAGWSTRQQLLTDALNQSQLPSLAVVGGFPCIAYANRSSNKLELLVGLDSAGRTFAPSLPLVSVDVDSTALLDRVDRPAVAYMQDSDGSLRFVLAQ